LGPRARRHLVWSCLDERNEAVIAIAAINSFIKRPASVPLYRSPPVCVLSVPGVGCVFLFLSSEPFLIVSYSLPVSLSHSLIRSLLLPFLLPSFLLARPLSFSLHLVVRRLTEAGPRPPLFSNPFRAPPRAKIKAACDVSSHPRLRCRSRLEPTSCA
jgi:hypothetical protein